MFGNEQTRTADRLPADSTALIVNESSLKVMKFKNPIGKTVYDLGVKWHIVGVIKGFILTSPYEPTRPILICGAKSSFMTFYTVLIKLNGNNSTADNLKRAGGWSLWRLMVARGLGG